MKLPIVKPRFPKIDVRESMFESPCLATWAAELDDCLDDGIVTNNGLHVQLFERKLTDYLGAPTLAFNSGMSALTAMLLAADVRGGEVILPSFTFPATPQAVILAGATPVFADIDPNTLTIDPADAELRITDNTKAILAVDVYGIPSRYDELAMIAKDDGVWFLVDSAPAFGSYADGKPVGCNADAQIFSFHATKPFSTMEGGCLCSKEAGFIYDAAAFRNFGQHEHGVYPYGLNGKMMEVCALIGLEQLKTWDVASKVRKSAAAMLRLQLGEMVEIELPFPNPMDSPIWTYCPILVDEAALKCTRDEFRFGLAGKGIERRAYYTACHKFYGGEAQLPITDEIARRVVALPVYNDMTTEEIDYIVDSIKELVAECKTSSSSVPVAISASPSAAS